MNNIEALELMRTLKGFKLYKGNFKDRFDQKIWDRLLAPGATVYTIDRPVEGELMHIWLNADPSVLGDCDYFYKLKLPEYEFLDHELSVSEIKWDGDDKPYIPNVRFYHKMGEAACCSNCFLPLRQVLEGNGYSPYGMEYIRCECGSDYDRSEVERIVEQEEG